MDSCVNNNSLLAVGVPPNQGHPKKKISHKTAPSRKRIGRGYTALSQLSVSRPSDSSTIVSFPFQIPTSKESRSQSVPIRGRHSCIKCTCASRHSVPLFPDIPVDPRMGCDVVTDAISVKTFNASQGPQRGTLLSTSGSSLNSQSRLPKTRQHHTSNVLSSLKLDVIESRQESDGDSTTSNSEVPSIVSGAASVDTSRGFRARLMLSEARKTIQNCKLGQSDSSPKRNHPRTPLVMDIVLELKAQYAGYTTDDLYITLEAMRRREDARPVFKHLVHDFSAGAESVDAYWDNQAKVWQDWKIPADEGVDSGGTGGLTFSPESEPERVVGIYQRLLGIEDRLPSSSLSIGRTNFPDSIERSTASWCPVLRCNSATDVYRHSHS